MAEQDHHHHPGRDDAEERADLQLLQDVAGESSCASLRLKGADGADEQDESDDASVYHGDRPVLEAEAARSLRRSSEDVQLVFDAQHPERAEADRGEQHEALEQRLVQRMIDRMRKLKATTRRISAPNIDPIAPPMPPNSEVPPITTAAIEFKV